MAHHTLMRLYVESHRARQAVLSQEAICPICLDTYTHHTTQLWQTPIVETPCKHVFHYVCLHRWFSVGKATCPVCREVLHALSSPPNQFRHVYEDAEDASSVEDTRSLVFSHQSSYESLRERLFDVASEARFEENRVLRMFEDTSLSQRQCERHTVRNVSINLPRDFRELAANAIQLYLGSIVYRVDERESDWRTTNSMPLNQPLPNFRGLDASFQQLIADENYLRFSAKRHDNLESRFQECSWSVISYCYQVIILPHTSTL